MKLILLLLTLITFSAYGLQENNPSYETIMKEHIELLNNAGTISELQKAANAFQRISGIHDDEWLPPYYTALAYANMGYISNGGADEKDAFFTEAEKHLNRAETLSENSAEITTLKGYILMGRLNADPGNRGQRLSPRIFQLFEKALQMDPENPRAAILLARMEYGMAGFMGQNTAYICERISTHKELFSKSKDDTLLPAWGEYILDNLLKECK